MTSSQKIAIVGAGHNALVCACYLAKAGHDATVSERRARVGGAVNTGEMWDGYQVDIPLQSFIGGQPNSG